jgi:hypothetical protein
MKNGHALLAGLVLVGLSALAGTFAAARNTQAAMRAPRGHQVHVILNPRVVAPYLWSTLDLVGAADASAVAVRLSGASGLTGRPLPWTELRRDGDRWTSRLPQPVLAGIYPIEVRTRPSSPVASRPVTYLRVFWPGTETRPSFSTAGEAVKAWVEIVAGGTLDASRRWPGTAIDHRLPALHRLFVVAYNTPGQPAAADRLGAWVTVVREGFHGRWRLLEASASPP